MTGKNPRRRVELFVFIVFNEFCYLYYCDYYNASYNYF